MVVVVTKVDLQWLKRQWKQIHLALVAKTMRVLILAIERAHICILSSLVWTLLSMAKKTTIKQSRSINPTRDRGNTQTRDSDRNFKPYWTRPGSLLSKTSPINATEVSLPISLKFHKKIQLRSNPKSKGITGLQNINRQNNIKKLITSTMVTSFLERIVQEKTKADKHASFRTSCKGVLYQLIVAQWLVLTNHSWSKSSVLLTTEVLQHRKSSFKQDKSKGAVVEQIRDLSQSWQLQTLKPHLCLSMTQIVIKTSPTTARKTLEALLMLKISIINNNSLPNILLSIGTLA